MKARPRRVENRVADELNVFFKQSSLSEVERIPVLGRPGPDITWNELELIVDVKSRKSNPKSFRIPTSELRAFGFSLRTYHLLGVRLRDINLLFEPFCVQLPLPSRVIKPSVVVEKWWYHMDDWTVKNYDQVPNGISGMVLHWPGSNVKNSVLIIHQKDRRALHDRYHSHVKQSTV